MTDLERKLARARFLDRRSPRVRASFTVQEAGIPEPEGARPLVEPEAALVCRAKLEVERHKLRILEKDREAQ